MAATDKNPDRQARNVKIAAAVMRRHATMVEARRPHEARWKRATRLFYPQGQDIDRTGETPAEIAPGLYDGTPQAARRVWVHGMMGNLVSPSLVWLRHTFGDPAVEGEDVLRQFLQDSDAGMYSAYRASRTYYAEIRRALTHLSVEGTAYLYADDDPAGRRTVFFSPPPADCWAMANQYGDIDTVHRQFRLSARNAIALYGEEVLPKKTRDEAERNPDMMLELLHVSCPNSDAAIYKCDEVQQPWLNIVLLTGEAAILSLTGYWEKNPAVCRYETVDREVYGISPAMLAMVDALQAQQFTRLNLEAAHEMARPARILPLSLKKDGSPRPGKIYWSDSPDQRRAALNEGISLPASIEMQSALRESVERHFSVQFFLFLQRLREGTMTIPELMQRKSEQALLLAPEVGNIIDELIEPAHQRAFGIEMQRVSGRRMPEPPQEVIEYMTARQRERVDVEMVGPLAQVQQSMFRTEGILQGMEMLRAIAQTFGPEALLKVNQDKLVERSLEGASFPQDLIRSDEEVAAIRQAAQQQQEALAQAQMAEQVAGAMNKAGKAPEAGSPAEQIISAAQ